MANDSHVVHLLVVGSCLRIRQSVALQQLTVNVHQLRMQCDGCRCRIDKTELISFTSHSEFSKATFTHEMQVTDGKAHLQSSEVTRDLDDLFKSNIAISISDSFLSGNGTSIITSQHGLNLTHPTWSTATSFLFGQ
jgi:hypothetical protein